MVKTVKTILIRVSNSENCDRLFLDMDISMGISRGMDTAPSTPSAASSLAAGPGASSFRPGCHPTHGPVIKHGQKKNAPFINDFPHRVSMYDFQVPF